MTTVEALRAAYRPCFRRAIRQLAQAEGMT